MASHTRIFAVSALELVASLVAHWLLPQTELVWLRQSLVLCQDPETAGNNQTQ